MTTRIAVIDDYQNVAHRLADWRVLQDADVHFFHDHLVAEDDLADRLAGFQVIVLMRERTPFTGSLLRRLPALRLLVTTGRRNFAIDLATAKELGLVVSGTGGDPRSAAELTWGLILALARNIPVEDRRVREGGWQMTVGRLLGGQTLGMLGLGKVGTAVATVGLAFGMRVIAWSPNMTMERAAKAGAEFVDRDRLFGESDVLTIHLVLSDSTRGLVGQRELGLMKRDAYLVNSARGPLVDEAALIHALTTGQIAGAALDVFNVEPLPAHHAFRQLPNVVVTPHLGFVTEAEYRNMYCDAVEDIAAFLSGGPLRLL